MNSKFLLIVLSFAGFTSCTTAYKTGQTPDDVYYSPAHPVNDHSRYDSNQDRTVYNNSSYDPYYDRSTTYGRSRGNYVYYSYDPCYPGYIDPKIIKPAKYTAPRRVNTGAYNKGNTDNSVQTKTSKSGSGVGNFIREIFNTASSTTSGNSGSSTKSGSGSTSSGSKSTSTSVPVRTFGNK